MDTIDRYSQTIRDAAAGCSVQARSANMYWMALIVASASSLTLTGAGSGRAGQLVRLPFELGEVTSSVFYAICLVIISGIAIAYCTAHVEVTRGKEWIKTLVAELEMQEERDGIPPDGRESRYMERVHSLSVVANLNKVSSIPQYLFGDRTGRQASSMNDAIYLVLKTVSWVFTYGIPVIALVHCMVMMCRQGFVIFNSPAGNIISGIMLSFVSAVASGCLVLLIAVDILWTGRRIAENRRKMNAR